METLGTISLLLLFICLIIWLIIWASMARHIIMKNITKEILTKLNIKLWIFYFLSLGFGTIAVYVLQSRGPGLISLVFAGVLQILITRLWIKKLGTSQKKK